MHKRVSSVESGFQKNAAVTSQQRAAFGMGLWIFKERHRRRAAKALSPHLLIYA